MDHIPVTDPIDANGNYAFEVKRMVYPLTALCVCGETITRKSRDSKWEESEE